ncbi:transcriptional repressor [Brevibacillus sp. SYSU BS000544]|uniref:transcriptional repressor n=1 Tax=Brevibacillus sp. SYSU BS000544 TaxID=3416443 RepID=UPI003CE55750
MTLEDKILQILKTQKIRHNDKREKLIKILRDNDREMELSEITTEMRKQFPNITHTTINSNLRTFEMAGLLVKTGSYGDTKYAISAGRIHHHAKQSQKRNEYVG